MKRRIPKITVPAVLVLLLICQILQVRAADYMTIALKSAFAAENTLFVLADADIPDPEEAVTFDLTIDGVAKDMVMTTAGDAGIPVTYLMLIDVSGSMSAANREEIRSFADGMIDGMREGDRAALSFMGERIEATTFTEDRDALHALIAGMPQGAAFTNLYYGIYHGLRILEDHGEAGRLTCLVIISDGEDTGPAGITQAEAESKIDSARISVCTVGVSTAGNKKMQESEKILGSFARRSAGGLHRVIGADGVTAEHAAAEIHAKMRNTLMLAADISDFAQKGDTATIALSATSERFGTTSDTLVLPSDLILQAQTAPDAEPEEAESGEEADASGADTGTTDAAEEDAASSSYTLPLILIICGILCAIAAVLLFVRAKKMREREEALEFAQMHAPKGTLPPDADEDTAPVQEAVPECGIRLTKVGIVETEERKVTVRGSLVIGRSQEADLVIAEQKISARHCRLEYDGEKLTVTDLDSTNGTMINGVPVTRTTFLQDQDILTIGGSEWRISM